MKPFCWAARLIGLALVVAATSFVAGCTKGTETFTTIAIDPSKPDVVYAANYQQIIKSRDGGQSWKLMMTGMGPRRIQSLAVDPTNSAVVYAGPFGEAVYKSTDAGNRWQLANAGLKEHVMVINQFVFHPRNPLAIYIATTVGVFETHDGGLDWEEMSNKNLDSVYVVALVLDYADPRIFYAGTSGGVYKSMDGGKVWLAVNKGLIEAVKNTGMALGVNTMVQHPTNPAILYIGTTQGAFKTVDAAQSWRPIQDQMEGLFVSSLAIDPQIPETLYAASSKGMFKSDNGGESWRPINTGLTNLNIRSLAIDPARSEMLYAGTYGGLFKSTDSGESWNRLPTQIEQAL